MSKDAGKGAQLQRNVVNILHSRFHFWTHDIKELGLPVLRGLELRLGLLEGGLGLC